MPSDKKNNHIATVAGILMIIISVLNYLMNDDYVSLGIFVFLGLGFILLGIKSKFEKTKATRINKYAMTFFFGAFAIFIYWIAAVKFHLF